MRDENKDHGNYLAMVVAIRVLAQEVAKLAAPGLTAEWFTALSQEAFAGIDETSNPRLDENTMKQVKEAGYDALRMIFDAKGFKA
jgi:hypothetical protein